MAGSVTSVTLRAIPDTSTRFDSIPSARLPKRHLQSAAANTRRQELRHNAPNCSAQTGSRQRGA